MKRIASYLLLLSFALAFTACREKEQPTVAQMKGVFYAGAPGLEEVIEIVPGKSKTVDLQAYADQVSDIVLNLTLKVDPDGAAAYNGAHGTDYPMCPGSAYEFTTNKVLMPRYGKASTSAKLKLSASGLEEDVVYVVPVNIDEVIGTDNWERSSSPYAYVLVKRAYVAPDAGSGTKNDPYNLYMAADSNIAKNGGLILGAVFLAISILFIFNTIRMAIFSRREEINMMKLVGADRSFIRGPFLVEARLSGAISGVFAATASYFGFKSIYPTLESYGISISEFTKYFESFWLIIFFGVMILTGMLIGSISARLALKKYLKKL